MEEKKKPVGGAEGVAAEEPKLSYEELNQNFIDLNIGYQKLLAEYRKVREAHDQAVAALQAREFDYMSFFLTMLFKVVEHPEMYEEGFVDWATKNIQGTLTGFADGMRESSGENDVEKEKATDKKHS